MSNTLQQDSARQSLEMQDSSRECTGEGGKARCGNAKARHRLYSFTLCTPAAFIIAPNFLKITGSILHTLEAPQFSHSKSLFFLPRNHRKSKPG